MIQKQTLTLGMGGGAFAATLTLTRVRLNVGLLFLCEELTGEYLKHASTPPHLQCV